MLHAASRRVTHNYQRSSGRKLCFLDAFYWAVDILPRAIDILNTVDEDTVAPSVNTLAKLRNTQPRYARYQAASRGERL